MADKRISDLNLHTNCDLSDSIPIVNGVETRRITFGSLYYEIRDGVVSGSSQISFTGITDKPTLISGSSQVNIYDTTGFTEFSASISASNVHETPGWARYDDTQYTTSSVFTLTPAAGEQRLPNNGGYRIEEHLHSSVSFYNTGSRTIQVENSGDVYMCTIVFDAKTANANAAFMRIQLDSNGTTPYERVGKDLFFGKGNNVWHEFHEVFQWYADDDFVQNGNVWRVQSFGADVNIANVIFFIQRTQKHLD